jgi:hypothetical protein
MVAPESRRNCHGFVKRGRRFFHRRRGETRGADPGASRRPGARLARDAADAPRSAPVRCAAVPSEPAEAERLSPAPPGAGSRARRLLGLATIDVGPLRRHRDFRLLFAGQAATFFGSMLTYVAIPFQAYRLSGSSLVVGLLGVAELVPLLATAFAGGALADAIDRRRLVLLTELGLAGATALLLANALVPTRASPCSSSSPRSWPASTGSSGRRSRR